MQQAAPLTHEASTGLADAALSASSPAKARAAAGSILLIGASGFIGSTLLGHLSRLLPDLALLVPSRRAWRHQALSTMPRVQLIQSDIHDLSDLKSLVRSSSPVINLAGILHSDRAKPWGRDFDRVHVQLPLRLLEALDHQALIHISALGCQPEAVDQAPSMYLRSKSYAEQQLLQSGHPLSVVRPSVVFGPGDRFLHVFAKLGGLSPIIPLAGAQARFAPVHVHDLCEAIGLLVLHRFDRLANRRPPGLLDLGIEASIVLEAFGPKAYSLADLLRFATHAAHGSSPWIVPLPYTLGAIQARLFEALPGPPLMSLDNLDSMRIDNLPSGKSEVLGVRLKTLDELGIRARGLETAREDLRRR